MELHKKSELSVGRSSFVISTQLAGDASPAIETKVIGGDGSVVFQTSQDISALRPIFQNSQRVFARLEAQHQSVVDELQQGRIGSGTPDAEAETASTMTMEEREADALAHATDLLGKRSYEKATAAFRAVLETYPNCSEARELLEVSYKASAPARLPVDVELCLRRGTEAFAAGRQREAIEYWKQCLVDEPDNRRLQLLVLLATTWSPARRQSYAEEVLASASGSLGGGRAEEVQALLLITQTVEGATAVLTPAAAADARAETAPPVTARSALDETMVQDLPDLESLVFEFSEPPPEPQAIAAPQVAVSDAIPPAPVQTMVDEEPVAPLVEEQPMAFDEQPMAFDEQPTAFEEQPPAFEEQPMPFEGQPPMALEEEPFAAEELPAAEEPFAADAAVPAEPPPAAEPPPPPADRPAAPRPPRPEPRTPPRSAAHRKPAPRPRRGAPWPWIAAAVVLVALGSGLAFFMLSGDRTVPPARLEQAASLVSAGQNQQAIAAYDELLTDFGDDARIFLGRGRAKLAAGDAAGGLSDLERAYSLDPQSTAIAEEIADIRYSQGNYPSAIDYYEKAFQGGAGSAEGRYRLAVSQVRQGRGDDAVEHLKAAITKDPGHGEAQFLYGQLLNERGRHQEAEAALRAAEPNVEAGSDYLSQLGIALLEQAKLNEAEEIAVEFIRTYPEDARARSLLGEVYLHRKQYEPARAQLILALRTNPTEPRAQLALGRTWLAIGKTRGDAQDLAKAQQVLASAQGVDEGKRLLALGQVSLAEGDLVEAQSLLQQSLDRGAPGLDAHLSLAEAKSRAKDLTGAAEELQQASGLAPADPAIPLSLGITYFQLKDTTRAADEFLKALQGVGLITPPGEASGPVVLPEPYVPLPDRFNVNRAIRESFQQILKQSVDDPTATQLKALSENATFVLGRES
jgi:tetratricopeptide (TPR) repeat protein